MANILLIEDDHLIADLYIRSLTKAGHNAKTIGNGEVALAEAKKIVYDVILLDLMLPDRDGVEILENLRGEDGSGLPLTKIIVTTNFDEPEEDRTRLEKLADGYLIKADVTPGNLVDLVNQVLA